jgi:hypothetical protein
MRDTITSTFDAAALSPLHFFFRQRENSKVIDTEAKLDKATKRWAVNRQEKGKKRKTYEFKSQNTLDPITATYLARSIDFKVGDRLYFNVFGGRSRYVLELLVEAREPVELESGKVVDALLSADERRIPVRLSSKVFVGTVNLEIVQDKHGIQSTSADRSPSSS